MGRPLLGATLAMVAALGSADTPRPSPPEGARARIEASYGQLPLRFERNEGQVDSRVRYVAGQTRANNAVVSLNTSGVLTVRCAQASGTVDFILDVNGYFE